MEQQLNNQALSADQILVQFWPFILLTIALVVAVVSMMMLYRSRNQLSEWITESRLLQGFPGDVLFFLAFLAEASCKTLGHDQVDSRGDTVGRNAHIGQTCQCLWRIIGVQGG